MAVKPRSREKGLLRKHRMAKSPLHSASVHITEYVGVPNPRPLERDDKQVARDYLSPSKLKELSGCNALTQVHHLELQLNTAESSLGNFGLYVPNLTELKLEDSVVPCIRDLGTGLHALKILWMPRCKLGELDGLAALQNLQELYVAFNEIHDLSLVTMLSHLQVLDLESNNLNEVDQLGYLALCQSLRSLTLEGNPLCTQLAGEGGEEAYRCYVKKAVPSLTHLDDVSMTTGDALRSKSSLFSLTSAGMDSRDWHAVQGAIKCTPFRDDQRNTSPHEDTPSSPGHLDRRNSQPEDSSDLTHGAQVICGNPASALRGQKLHLLSSKSAILSPSSYKSDTPPNKPPISFAAALLEDGVTVTAAKSMENLLEGLEMDDGSSLTPDQGPRPILSPTPPPPHPPHGHRQPQSGGRRHKFSRTSSGTRLPPPPPHSATTPRARPTTSPGGLRLLSPARPPLGPPLPHTPTLPSLTTSHSSPLSH